MKKIYNCVFIGLGGQGILFTAKTVSKAAMACGYNVVMNEVHGLAQRGGTVITNVRIGPVDSPMIPDGEADIVVSSELNETLRVAPKASSDSVTLASSVPIYPLTSFIGYDDYPSAERMMAEIEAAYPRVLFIDQFQIARDCGHVQVANAVLLGALIAADVLPLAAEDVLGTIKKNVGFMIYRVNKKAFSKGFDAMKKKLEEVRL